MWLTRRACELTLQKGEAVTVSTMIYEILVEKFGPEFGIKADGKDTNEIAR